jgi:hypothetical protein
MKPCIEERTRKYRFAVETFPMKLPGGRLLITIAQNSKQKADLQAPVYLRLELQTQTSSAPSVHPLVVPVFPATTACPLTVISSDFFFIDHLAP